MKDLKIWLLVLVAVLISGCTKEPRKTINFTKPILQTKVFPNSKIYVKFTNTSRVDSNLTTTFINNLKRDGYEVTTNENTADISIKGNLEYFRRSIIKNRDPFLEYCSPQSEFWGDCYDKRTNSYIYDASLTLLINSQATSINFISHKNINSLSTMLEIFNSEIYDSIISTLKR